MAADIAFAVTLILLCSVNHDLNLCNSSESYSYTNYSARTESCGCAQQELCVGKCCQKKFVYLFMEKLNARKCTESTFQNSLLFYENERNSYDQMDNYINGRFNCTSIEQSPPNFNLYNSITEEKCYVQENGTLYYPFSPHEFYNNSQYCVDEVKVYICRTPTPEDPFLSTFEMLNILAMIISLPFLVATLTVVTITRKTSLHKKALILFVLTLSLRYIVEIGNEFYRYDDTPPRMCSIIGYSKIFFLFASFLWSNIICWDIWFTFSERRGINRNTESGSKNFLVSSLYVWGITIILTSIILLLNVYGDENASWHPGIGPPACFIQSYLATFIFFYLPIIILITFNFILFVLTAHNIRKIEKEISSFGNNESRVHSRNADKKRYQLYLKLLFGTGINWGMDVASFITVWVYSNMGFNDSDILKWIFYVAYIIDMHDALYGIFVFFIFAFKEEHWQFLMKKCALLFKKRIDPTTNAEHPPCRSSMDTVFRHLNTKINLNNLL